MSSQETPPPSLPLGMLRSKSKGKNLTAIVKTKKKPKRVSICGVHDIAPSQSESKNNLHRYSLHSHGMLPSATRPLLGANPRFSLPSGIVINHACTTVGSNVGQSDINGGIAHYNYLRNHGSYPSVLHKSQNVQSVMGAPFLHLQYLLQQQRAQLAHYINQRSTRNDAVEALLCLRNSSLSVPITTTNNTDRGIGVARSTQHLVQARKSSASSGVIMRSLLPKKESSKQLAASILPTQWRPCRLSMPNDIGHLNSLHRFVRSQLLELFEPAPATETNQKHWSPVGLRCIHCARANRKHANFASMSSFFPKSLEDIYVGVCTWQRLHFPKCSNIPAAKSRRYQQLKECKNRGKKAYWAHSAYELGLRNVSHRRDGIMWCQASSTTKDTENVSG